MSVLSQPHSARLNPPTLPVYRFSVEQYLELLDSGVLKDAENVELLEGLIVPKMTRNAPHDLALELCDEKIRVVLPADWRVRIQSAVVTLDSVPEPDVAVVRGHALSRRGRHPSAKEVGLLIEVAEASLNRDRTEKARLYAHSSIAWYWIVNLIDNRVEVYSDPTGPDGEPHYRQRRDMQPTDRLSVILDGVEVGQIAVAELLP